MVQLSSLDIYTIQTETQELIGSYINKCYQLNKKDLLIKFRNKKEDKNEAFFIRNGEFLAITDKKINTPMHPTSFAMTLRKYLQNGIINSISQHEFDRILEIKVGRKEGEYTLVIECFSDGNVILLDTQGKIILPFIKQKWSHRTIKSREEYRPPPSQKNPFEINEKKFKKIINESDSDIVRTLAVKMNLGGKYAEEICTRANIDKNKKIKDMKDKEKEKTYQKLTEILNLFKNKKIDPVITKRNQKKIDVLPFQFQNYTDVKYEKIPSFTRGLEIFIKKTEKTKKEKTKKEEKLDKLNRRLKQQEKAIQKFKQKIEKKQFEGELIYLNYKKIDRILKKIQQMLQEKNKKDKIKEIAQEKSVENFDPTKNQLTVTLNDKKGKKYSVDLNFRKNPIDNAEEKYLESKKMKKKKQGAEKSYKHTIKKIKKTKKTKEKKQRSLIRERKDEKTFWFEKYKWFISSDGNIVVAGKDAKTNEEVVKKYLQKGDRYAHADIKGAPSCIIKDRDIDNNKVPISEKTLEEACIFAVSHSKSWKQFAEGSAYWVTPEQVSKTPQSGEFLPKGAFMIRGKRNYHRCELKLAVGKINVQGYKKIMTAPVSAIKEKTDKYVIIKPGNTEKNKAAKKMADLLDANQEEINKTLPPGSIKLIKTRKPS
ncbi:MAG: ribosome rescue protein RqcH [Candidatus Thermoplasmatota archaeon]